MPCMIISVFNDGLSVQSDLYALAACACRVGEEPWCRCGAARLRLHSSGGLRSDFFKFLF